MHHASSKNCAYFIFAVFTSFAIFTSPALAHDELALSNPQEGQILQQAPQEIELNFNNEVMTMGAEISVQDDKNQTVSEGSVMFHGKQVVQKLKNNLAQGSYNAAWRVVSSDGHPIGGNIAFSIGRETTVSPQAHSSNDSSQNNTVTLVILGAIATILVGATAVYVRLKHYSKESTE